MVVKRRLLLAVASALTLVLTAAAPMMGASKRGHADSAAGGRPAAPQGHGRQRHHQQGRHRGRGLARVQQARSAVPGLQHQRWRDYSRTNGNLRRYPIVGDPQLGISLDICAGRVWVASGYRSPSDKAGDSDVFLTSRTIGGGAAQALMTSTADDRRVRDVTVSCVGNDLIAIGWLEKTGNKSTAQLMLRSLEPLGTTPSFKETYNLGAAELKSGLDVAATPSSVAVAFVRDGDLRLKRFDIGDGPSHQQPARSRPSPGTTSADPVMDARGKRLVVTYSDAGKVRLRTSRISVRRSPAAHDGQHRWHQEPLAAVLDRRHR